MHFEKFLLKFKKISELEKDHIALAYCKARAIPNNILSEIYYASNIETIIQNLEPELELHEHHIIDSPDISPLDWRVTTKKITIIPEEENHSNFIIYASKDQNNKIIDLSLRRINYNNVYGRYYSIIDIYRKVKSNSYGLEKVDFNKPFYVVEGFFDHLALDNSIACCGFFNINDFLEDELIAKLDKSSITIVLDHEIESYCQLLKLKWLNKQGYSLCLFPILESDKDLNQKLQNGMLKEEINDYVHKNSTRPGMVQNYKLWKRIIVYKLILYSIMIKNFIKKRIWN